MKIAVSTEDGKNVCGHVGKCDMFIIYETEGSQIVSKKIIDNIFTEHHNHTHENNIHSHNSHVALLEALKDCDTLISMGMGWRLKEDLSNNNINPIITDIEDSQTAVELFLVGKLVNYPDKACVH